MEKVLWMWHQELPEIKAFDVSCSSIPIIFQTLGKMRGVPALQGYPAHGIPTHLDHLQTEEHHEPEPLPPLRALPPL